MAGKGKGLAIGKKTNIVEKPVTGNDDDNTIDQSTAGAANRINGGDGNDNIVGTGFADRVNAGDGDDTVMGGAGDDVLFGNDGKDTAAYEGSIFNFMWEEGKGNSLTVTDTTGAEGIDTLKHFECLSFDDYTFDLTGPNAALILADDQGTDEDNATTFGIEAWDFDGGSPFISSISVTGGGTVSASSTGSLAQGMGTGTSFDISYDPNGAYETLAVGTSTTETITVVIDDGQGNLSSKEITVTIDGVNDAPTLGAGAMGAIEDGAVEVLDLSALGDDIDSDDDGDSLSYTVTGAPTEGSASIIGTDLAFDPGADFQNLAVGETRDVIIEVTATDAHGATAVNNVTVTVTGTNDAPTLSAAATSATEDGASVDVDLAALGADVDSDDDGSTLTYSVSGTPAEGSASVNGTTLTFDPGADFQNLAAGETRDVTMQVVATDRHGATASNDVTVTVTGVNDAPQIGAALTSGSVTAVPTTPETTGNSEIEFSVNQYLGYGGNNEATMRNIIANPAGYEVHSDTTNVIDYTDDPAGFSGELPGSSPWPAEQHYGGAGTGQWYNNSFFAHITTEFSVANADTYTFRTFNDDGVFLYIDGVRVIYDTGYHPEYPFQGSIALSPGNHTLELFFFEGGGEASLELSVRDSSGNYGLLGEGGGGLGGTGIVLTDGGSIDFTDVDLSDSHTVSVSANEAGYLGDMSASVVDASTGDGTGSVDWDFSVSNDDLAYLAVGESLTQSYTITVTDNNGASATETVTVTLNGTNDDPTASAIVAPATHEDAGVAAIDLLATAADVDASDDLDVANVSASSSDGRTVAFSVDNETGAFSIDPSQYNDLAVGESATVTVEYDVVDGNGGVVANTASITVDGRNDAVTATGGSGSVTEDATTTANGTIAVSDADTSDTHSFSVLGGGNGTYGSLSVDGNGDWTYALNNGAANVQALAAGQTVYENFTVNVSDGNGSSDTANVQVAVSGTNDAPVAQNVTLVAAVTGNSGFDNGWAGWTRDAGPNGGLNGIYIASSYNYSFNINTSGNLIPGDYAVADISFGGWLNQYRDGPNLGTAFGPKLISDDFAGRAGDLVSFEYRAYSGGDAASMRAQLINVDTGAVTQVFYEQTPIYQTSPVRQIDVPIAAAGNYRIEFTVGSFDQTDGGWVGARLAIGTAGIVRSGVSEGDATTFEAIQFLNDATDVDNGATISLHSVDATSALGASVSIDGAGNVFYDASGITHLGAGESAVDTFTYWITDEHGALAQAEASITVNGVNDAPTATGDTGSVTEDGTLVATGNLGASDPDANDTLSYSLAGSATGTYGSIGVDANGNWTYTLNNDDADLDNLDAGQSAVDSFVFNVSDGNGGSTTANVDVTVNGADEVDLSFEGSFDGWTTLGNVSISTDITAADGIYSAKLVSNGATEAQIEALFGAGMDNNATNGSAMYTEVNMSAGDELVFNWRFVAGDYIPYNDFAFFLNVNGNIQKLADVGAVGDYGTSIWEESSFVAAVDGVYGLGFGVMNYYDQALDSTLYIDNIHFA